MKSQLNRKTFLQATLATTLTGALGCAGEEDGVGGDGDGSMSGGASSSGGTGSSTGGAAAGGGDPGTGGAAAGGGDPGTGGAAAGGGDPGAGGTGTGGDGSGGAGGMMCDADITVTSSGDGHVHMATITVAMMMGGVDVMVTTFDDPGEDTGHDHDFALTAAELMTIRNGGEVIVDVCSMFTSHQFVISCVAGATAPVEPPTCN